MNKEYKKNGFSKIEMIVLIVIITTLVIVGVIIANKLLDAKKSSNLKDEADVILQAAKTSYINYKNDDSVMTPSEDGTSKGMCITLKGLEKNDYLKEELTNWDGYIVIEEDSNSNVNYSLWLTNKKLVINGYDSEKLNDLSLKKGITKYDKEDFSSSVKKSFTSANKDKGGTSKKYNAPCIDSKVE